MNGFGGYPSECHRTINAVSSEPVFSMQVAYYLAAGI